MVRVRYPDVLSGRQFRKGSRHFKERLRSAWRPSRRSPGMRLHWGGCSAPPRPSWCGRMPEQPPVQGQTERPDLARESRWRTQPATVTKAGKLLPHAVQRWRADQANHGLSFWPDENRGSRPRMVNAACFCPMASLDPVMFRPPVRLAHALRSTGSRAP